MIRQVRIVQAADFIMLLNHPECRRVSRQSAVICDDLMIVSLEPPENAVAQFLPRKSEKA